MKKYYFLLAFFLLFIVGPIFSQGYNVTSTQTCTAVTGGIVTINFPNTPASVADSATLTVTYFGDVDGPQFNEWIEIFGENATYLGQPPAVPQCSGVGIWVYKIDPNTIASWASTGNSIDIVADAGTGTNSLGGACLNQAFCVTIQLEYPVITGPNNAGISSLVSPVNFCPGQELISVQVNNSGSNVISNVDINWEINGAPQTTVSLNTPLDTVNGIGSNSAIVNLGNYTFAANQIVNIKAWTSSPNGVTDTVNGNDTINVNVTPALSGNYTIGGNNPDFSNFTSAINTINASGICGPITFKVRSGTYPEQLTLGNVNGTSSTNTITFEADTGITTIPTNQFSGS